MSFWMFLWETKGNGRVFIPLFSVQWKKKLIKMTNKHCKTIPANLYAIFQVTISYIISHMMANRQKSKFFNSNYAIFYTAAVKFHLHLDLFKCGLTFWWLVQKLSVDISLCTSQKAIIFLQKTSNVVRGLKIYCMLLFKNFGLIRYFFKWLFSNLI